jgi:peptide/nickel transport system substrate-binding protein
LSITAPAVDPIGMGQDVSIAVGVDGPGTLALRYLLIDPATGSVVTSGDATPTDDPASFSVDLPADLTGTLFPGLYRLSLAATSDQVGLVAEQEVDLEVTP